MNSQDGFDEFGNNFGKFDDSFDDTVALCIQGQLPSVTLTQESKFQNKRAPHRPDKSQDSEGLARQVDRLYIYGNWIYCK